ncbi:putative dehydrogenase [Opitutaceae bacterium TAV1]|nr:putative dehydrogenase [Opitutaceae bacterium TAV1]
MSEKTTDSSVGKSAGGNAARVSPARVAIIGMGGFAGVHQNALVKLEELGQARLVATCDPRPEAFANEQERWRFAARGVRVFGDYRELLDACGAELDLIVIPTPISLHAEMHRAAVERGIPVYLEKPPSLDPAELESMIATDRAAKKATLVGFNFIIEKPRAALKQRILAGEFGALTDVRLLAQWPRTAAYFSRNNWAARLRTPDGRLLLDSCFGNAMAHYVHNTLYWAGPAAVLDWARLAQVKAELYRGNEIEGTDTFFTQAVTATGATIRIALTHACPEPHIHHETIVLEKARIRYVVGSHYEIVRNDGRTERQTLPPFDTLVENHLEYYRYLRGEFDRPATRLEDSRAFVHFNGLSYVASGEITTIPAAARHFVRNEKDQRDYLNVTGLAGAMQTFLDEGRWPSETCGWPRQRPAAVVAPSDITRLGETITRITGA